MNFRINLSGSMRSSHGFLFYFDRIGIKFIDLLEENRLLWYLGKLPVFSLLIYLATLFIFWVFCVESHISKR